MIQIRRSEQRGHVDHGWLDARHTFSFGTYLDPEHMGFGTLRVINQDRVRPGMGFSTHGHRDMEIVTYVLEGALEHKDSMGNGSQIRPGEVQLMSAGTGVTHSEFNASQDEPLHLLQMWVLPRDPGTEPRYEQRHFSEEERRNQLRLVVSPGGEDGALSIGQDARLFASLLDPGAEVTYELPAGRSAWLHVALGRVRLGDQELGPGDAAALRDEDRVTLQGVEPADLVLWEVTEPANR